MIASQILEPDSPDQPNAETGSLNPRFRSVLLDIRARYDAQRILGIGHSAQAFGHYLQNAGFTVASIQPIETSKNNSAELVPAHKFIIADDCQRSTESFDMAISIESRLSCLNLCQPVKLAAKNLRVDGVFILSVPYSSQMKNVLITLREQWNLPLSAALDCGQMQCWSIQCMTVLLKSKGFKVIELIGVRDSSVQWDSLVLVARRTGLTDSMPGY